MTARDGDPGLRGDAPARDGWLGDMRTRVEAALDDALGGARACGIVDFPRHLNVGDQAIWLGERAALDARGVRVVAACDRTSYGRRFRRALGDAPVCIHGGGNFGDLYPTHHALRERALRDLRDRPIVQLAQSIHFGSAEGLERTRRLIADHGRVTLVVRDRNSERFAREHFEARVVLCPDMAFALGPLARRPAELPVVHQARTDKESAAAPEGGTFDWLQPPADRAGRRRLALHRARLALATGRRESGRRAPTGPGADPLAAYDRFARWSVARGLDLLSRGEVVITDRLHGHILCVLAGIPHVVLGDRHGKIRAYWDAWTHAVPIAHWAEGPAAAGERARAMLA
jgi:exopolysaccharide biosynthesis predicted pyruvyltransferase EpsI